LASSNAVLLASVEALACAMINVSELDAIAPSRALFSSGDTLSANLIPDCATVSTSAGGGVAHAANPRIAAVTAMDAFPGFPIMSITPLDFGMWQAQTNTGKCPYRSRPKERARADIMGSSLLISCATRVAFVSCDATRVLIL
jgi:hypothetical protein